MHSRGFDGFQIPPLLLWSSSEHIHSGRIEGSESASSIIQKIHRGPQQGNEMDNSPSPFLCIHGTLQSNMLSLYFTFPWYLASTLRLRPFFPFGTLASGDKDSENKTKRRRQDAENDSDWLGWFCIYCVTFVCIGESHFLGITSSRKCEKKTWQKQKDDITELRPLKLYICPTTISFFVPPFPTILIPHRPLHRTFQLQGKDVITGIFALSLLPNRIEFQLAGPSCEQLFTHRQETRRLMPSGLTEKQTRRMAITCRLLFWPPFPLYMMWRPNSSVKHRLIFPALITAWESQGVFFFFLCAPFSHC